MKELIVISGGNIGGQKVNTVNGRDLHAFLEVGKDFSNWVKAQIERARLKENRDFVKLAQKGELSATGQTRTEYHLTIDAAKHIAMMSGTDKGFEVRDYFIECERICRQNTRAALPDFSNPITAARAWADECEQKMVAQATIEEQRPLVALAKAIEASTRSIKIGDYVKAISCGSGFTVGRNNFYRWLRDESILDHKNMPHQRYIDCGWFEVEEGTYENTATNGPRACFTTLVTGKGQVSLLERFRKSSGFVRRLNKSAAQPVLRQRRCEVAA